MSLRSKWATGVALVLRASFRRNTSKVPVLRASFRRNTSKVPVLRASFRRNAMKVAQHFSAGLGFLNARVPPGAIEYGLVPALEAPIRLCLSSLRDGVFFNLNPAMNCRATFAVSLRDSSRYRLPHSLNKPRRRWAVARHHHYPARHRTLV
jgi:hypothetical protein